MTQSPRTILINIVALKESLRAALPLIDNPERRADIERYLASTKLLVERGLHNLLAGLIQEINDAGGSRLRLEYAGGALSVVVEAQSSARPEPEPEPDFGGVDVEGDFEKVTIRLPSELKDLIGRAAQLRGLSQNSWYMRELARALARQAPMPPEPPTPGGRRGRRMRGYVGD